MENTTDQKCRKGAPGRGPAWFCIRSKPKQEHIAAANLKQVQSVEVFSPRLRSRKVTRRGPAWVTESLFPNYLFARFTFQQMLDQVRYTQGVSSVVHFAGRYPEVPEVAIEELRRNFTANELELSPKFPQVGDAITITTPAMFGCQGVVLRALPARQRVQVLVDLLGRGTTVELGVDSVVVEKRPLPPGLTVGPV